GFQQGPRTGHGAREERGGELPAGLVRAARGSWGRPQLGRVNSDAREGPSIDAGIVYFLFRGWRLRTGVNHVPGQITPPSGAAAGEPEDRWGRSQGVPAMITDDFNCARYRIGQRSGHYESYFLRANHPARPQGFWIRYTIFSPDQRPQDAIGELWAI